MAKTNPVFILIGVLVVAFVVLLLSSPGVVPYDNKKRNYAEAMKPIENSAASSNPVPVSTKQSGNNSASSGDGIASVVSNMLPSFGTENFEPMVDEPKSVQYGPFRDSEIIDRFSQVTSNGKDGVDGCVSSGLTNAGGYICLTPDLIQMLKTRGGNAKGT